MARDARLLREEVANLQRMVDSQRYKLSDACVVCCVSAAFAAHYSKKHRWICTEPRRWHAEKKSRSYGRLRKSGCVRCVRLRGSMRLPLSCSEQCNQRWDDEPRAS